MIADLDSLSIQLIQKLIKWLSILIIPAKDTH